MLFEDATLGDRELGKDADNTAAEWALGRVLHEIDDTAKATLGSITLATMLKQIARHRGATELKTAVG